MEFLQIILNIILHLDSFLISAMNIYGNDIFLIIALIIFLETGVVLTPFLPGDSLLFTAGALSHQSSISVIWLTLLLCAAAILGDATNYWIGRTIGKWLLKRNLIKQEHYNKAHLFYKKHGAKAVVLARFIPIIRTLVPFIAGLSHMSANVFTMFNIFGAIVWVILFVGGGYLFGTIPFVKDHFTMIIFLVIIVSFLPLIIHHFIHKQKKTKNNLSL